MAPAPGLGDVLDTRRPHGAEATTYLEGLLDQAMALQQVALAATKSRQSVNPGEFAAEYARGVVEVGVGGANSGMPPVSTSFLRRLRCCIGSCRSGIREN